MASPLATEITGRTGFDWLIADLEHGAGTEAELLPILLAAELSGAAAFVRPQSGERLRVGRALDLGAAGIMVPRLDTAAQVEEAVSFLRYPPDGVRGVALRTRGARLGTVGHGDVRTINRDIVGIIQIESPSAVREADAIAAIDGVDVLFVGTGGSLPLPGRSGPVRPPDLPRRARCRGRRHVAGTTSRRASCSTTTPRSHRTSPAGSGSSGSGPRGPSSPRGRRRPSRRRGAQRAGGVASSSRWPSAAETPRGDDGVVGLRPAARTRPARDRGRDQRHRRRPLDRATRVRGRRLSPSAVAFRRATPPLTADATARRCSGT